jgi:phytoene dehydrogenase-like protein
MRTTTPEDFEAVHLSAGGALYGPAIHSLRSLFQRPGAIGPGGRFVFAEGWTRSGGGIPQVVLSGQIAARELLVRLGRPTIEMPEAGPT